MFRQRSCLMRSEVDFAGVCQVEWFGWLVGSFRRSSLVPRHGKQARWRNPLNLPSFVGRFFGDGRLGGLGSRVPSVFLGTVLLVPGSRQFFLFEYPRSRGKSEREAREGETGAHERTISPQTSHSALIVFLTLDAWVV